MRIERLRNEQNVKINWVHFPLHPETPEQGQSIAELFAGRDLDLEAMHARMQALMDEEGLPYASRSHTFNSRLAQELAKWADTQPQGEQIHEALFKAYFVNGQNIADTAILLEIAAGVGLPVKEAKDVLVQRLFKGAVDEDWSRSRSYGISGVPTFVAGGYGVTGAQPYSTLVQFVEHVKQGRAS